MIDLIFIFNLIFWIKFNNHNFVKNFLDLKLFQFYKAKILNKKLINLHIR